MRLYTFINVKFAELVKDAMATVATAAEEGLKNTFLGSIYYGIVDPLSSNQDRFDEGARKAKQSSLGTFSDQSIQDLYSRENTDAFESDQIGQIYSMLLNEQKKVRFDTSKSAAIAAMIKKIDDTTGTFGTGLDEDEFVKGLAKNLASYRGITLDIDKANGIVQNAQNKLLGPGKMATLTATSDGLNVTQYAVGDNLVVAKPSEISYGGDAARGFQSVLNISAQQNAGQAMTQGLPTIKVELRLPNNEIIADAALDGKLLFKATQQINGRYTLPGNVVVDASGNSVEGNGF